LHVLLYDLAEPFVEDHDAVPLGLFLALAGGLVAPAFRSRNPQIGDRPAVLGAPDFRVRAHVADQDHLIHRASHNVLPLYRPERPAVDRARCHRSLVRKPLATSAPPRRSRLFTTLSSIGGDRCKVAMFLLCSYHAAAPECKRALAFHRHPQSVQPPSTAG